jgi:hypothetical protein
VSLKSAVGLRAGQASMSDSAQSQSGIVMDASQIINDVIAEGTLPSQEGCPGLLHLAPLSGIPVHSEQEPRRRAVVELGCLLLLTVDLQGAQLAEPHADTGIERELG